MPTDARRPTAPPAPPRPARARDARRPVTAGRLVLVLRRPAPASPSPGSVSRRPTGDRCRGSSIGPGLMDVCVDLLPRPPPASSAALPPAPGRRVGAQAS